MNRLSSPRLLSTTPSAALPHQTSCPYHTSAPRRAQRVYPTNYTPKGIGLAPIKPRQPAPAPPGWTPFAISNLLLDLDAYESRYARPYDADDDARQRTAWAPNPTRDGLKQAARDFAPEFRRANFVFAEAAAATAGDISSRKWRVGALDVLTAALLGVQGKGPDGKVRPSGFAPQQELAIVARQNAIPSSAAQGERLLEWLLHRQAQLDDVQTPDVDALEKRLDPAPEAVDGQEQDQQQQRPAWSGFLSWKRLVTAILQTESGAAILARRTDELARTLQGLSAPENVTDQLAFLNNLQVRFHDAGVELGSQLCGAGLVLAAEARQPRALARYLRLGASQGYWQTQTARERGSASADPSAELLPDLMLQNLRAVLVRSKDGRISFEESTPKLLLALDGEAAAGTESSIGQGAPASRQPHAASS
ncbi:hypothetical protein ACHAQA_001375 [Verticillium albo-atrum]